MLKHSPCGGALDWGVGGGVKNKITTLLLTSNCISSAKEMKRNDSGCEIRRPESDIQSCCKAFLPLGDSSSHGFAARSLSVQFLAAALVRPVLDVEKLYTRERRWVSKESEDSCRTVQTLSCPGRTGVAFGAVLSTGGSQHAARRGGGGRGTIVGVVLVGRRAREDGVAVCRGAAELEPP